MPSSQSRGIESRTAAKVGNLLSGSDVEMRNDPIDGPIDKSAAARCGVDPLIQVQLQHLPGCMLIRPKLGSRVELERSWTPIYFLKLLKHGCPLFALLDRANRCGNLLLVRILSLQAKDRMDKVHVEIRDQAGAMSIAQSFRRFVHDDSALSAGHHEGERDGQQEAEAEGDEHRPESRLRGGA